MEQKTYLSINGNSFLYRNTDINFISPLEAGYIITFSGDFVPVKDEDDHLLEILNKSNHKIKSHSRINS